MHNNNNKKEQNNQNKTFLWTEFIIYTYIKNNTPHFLATKLSKRNIPVAIIQGMVSSLKLKKP